MKSSTHTLISALRILARDIQSGDGVANMAIAEAADRMEEMQKENEVMREENNRLREDRDYQYNLNMDKEKSRRSSRPTLDKFYP
jgi:cell division protein FtsB